MVRTIFFFFIAGQERLGRGSWENDRCGQGRIGGGRESGEVKEGVAGEVEELKNMG